MMGSQTRRERSRGTASGARVTSRKTGKIMSDHRCVPCLWQPPGASRRPTAPRPLRRGLVAAAVMLAIGCAPPAWTQSITGGLHALDVQGRWDFDAGDVGLRAPAFVG